MLPGEAPSQSSVRENPGDVAISPEATLSQASVSSQASTPRDVVDAMWPVEISPEPMDLVAMDVGPMEAVVAVGAPDELEEDAQDVAVSDDDLPLWCEKCGYIAKQPELAPLYRRREKIKRHSKNCKGMGNRLAPKTTWTCVNECGYVENNSERPYKRRRRNLVQHETRRSKARAPEI